VRNILVKDLAAVDEVREAPKARIEVFWFPNGPVYRVMVEPEWRWSESLKETFGTTRCPVDHIAHMISGHIAIEMEDGSQRIVGPGQLWRVAPGHDAWVSGDEPAVFLDFADAHKGS
jgi:hypothetical protein